MTPELEGKLQETYPELFEGLYGSPLQTALAFGLECGDGWFDIIDGICHVIKEEINNREQSIKWADAWNKDILDPDSEYYGREPREVLEPITVTITQIKEKFGTLRFYYNGGDEYIDGAVRMAEIISANTCEVCGNRGSLNKGPWLRTLCDEHKED